MIGKEEINWLSFSNDRNILQREEKYFRNYYK